MEEFLQKTVTILRYRDGKAVQTGDQVIREHAFSVWLNGSCVESGTCVPDYLEELALGHLLTEGFLSAADEVCAVRADSGTGRVEVECRAHSQKAYPPLPALSWQPEDIMRTAGRFLEESSLFRATGSIHSALLCVDGAEFYCQCIGRHNAINKVVGRAMREGVQFGRAILYTSGRLPVSMAEKAVRAGIPVVVSRSAPTDATLDLAARTGLTVIGFARSDRMNLYHPVF